MTNPNEAWRKTHKACSVCDEKAVGCYSPDLDVHGLCFCKKHKEDIWMAYIAILSGSSKEIIDSLTEGWKHK